MIIEHIRGQIKDFDLQGKRVDRVVLDRDGMSRPHQKVKSASGEVFAISLPHGESLSPGAVIYEDEDRIVVIELAPEDALVIRPSGQMQWARAAYNIGNMHAPAFIQEDCIVTNYDAVLESVIQRLAIACERATCPIDGVRANVSQSQGHHHHHGHEHVHEAGHTHTHTHTHTREAEHAHPAPGGGPGKEGEPDE